MKIKHFAGYGSVKAVKSRYTEFTNIYGEKCAQLVISVSGNHEWGLVRDDKYDLFNWLFKKFNKTLNDYTEIEKVSYNDYYVTENGLDVEHCDYTFEFTPKRK